MVATALFLIAATLALFGYVRYRRAGFRINPDIWELRDDVDGLLKREATIRARERATHRRAVEGDSPPPGDVSPPSSVGPLGGVVRKESPVALPDIPRRARGG